MRRLAHAVTGHLVRILLVWLVAVAAVVVLTSAGSAVDRADVIKSGQADFLPGRCESVRAAPSARASASPRLPPLRLSEGVTLTAASA
jgi:hypothetical protein